MAQRTEGGRVAGPAAGMERGRGPTVPAPVLVLGSIASVQIGSALAKGLFDQAGPLGTVYLRLLFSGGLLTAAVRPKPWRWGRRTVGLAVVFGLVLAAMNFSFYEAISRIPLGPAVTIEFIGPLSVAVAGSRRPLDLLWALLAAGGVVLLGSGGGLTLTGGALALLAGAFWAAYILLSQRLGRALPGVQGLAAALAVGAVALTPFALPVAGSRLPHPHVLLVGFGVAMLSSAVPYGLELAALRRLPTRVFGVLMSLEPGMAALAGLVVLGEHLRAVEVVAIVLVCAASAGSTLAARRA